MDATYVKVSDLRPGLIISEDVFVNTNYPIIRKNTQISAEHLEVLSAFNVKKVKIADRIVVKKEENLDEQGTSTINPNVILDTMLLKKVDIETQYKEAVRNYKKEFTSWRMGNRLDIAKVRTIIIPLLETFNEQKKC